MALSYAFSPDKGETPETVARRRQVADVLAARIFSRAPQNVGEGINAIGQALIARSMANDADEAQKAGLASGSAAYASLFPSGATTSATAVPAPVTAPVAVPPPAAPTVGKIYSNDEPSPLDPPSGADRDALIQTVLGEAGNQGPVGMNAVASVIRNRAINGGYGGGTPTGVVTAPNQFEPWNTAGGRARMAAAAADPTQRAAAEQAIALAYGEGGNAPTDPTNGALNFFSPKAQAALGRPVPAWAQGPGQDIGDHRFFGGRSAQQPYQVAGPAVAAPQPAQVPTAPVTPLPQPSAAPTLDQFARVAANPWLSKGQQTVVNALLQQKLQESDPKRALELQDLRNKLMPLGAPFVDAQGNLVQRDAVGKVTVLKPSANAPSSVAEYNFYADQERQGGRDPLPFGQWDTQRKRAGATNVNTGTIPQGYEQFTDPATGAVRMRQIPGGPKDTSKADAAKEDARAVSTDVVTGAAQKARQAISSSFLPATGTAGAALSGIGETGAAEVYRQVEAIKSNAKIENLQAMRAASPTGGALGNVSNEENRMLADKAGALDPKSPHFLRDLDDYERALLRTIHGKEAGDRIYDQTRPNSGWADVGGVKIRRKQ